MEGRSRSIVGEWEVVVGIGVKLSQMQSLWHGNKPGEDWGFWAQLVCCVVRNLWEVNTFSLQLLSSQVEYLGEAS